MNSMILFGLILSPLLVWSYSLEELPLVRVTLYAEDPSAKWIDHKLHYSIEPYSIARIIIPLNCTYRTEGNGTFNWHDVEVAYHLNGELLGKYTMFNKNYAGIIDEELKWENSEKMLDLNSFGLNVYSNSSNDRENKRSTSLWIQPLSARASGNYSCAVWLGTQDNKKEAKFFSRLLPIQVEEI